MRKENGITLISLIIYIIVLTFVIAGVSQITASFYSNIHEFDNESDSVVSYTKFNMIFLNDVKKQGIEVEEIGDNYLVFIYTDNAENIRIQYLVQNNALYRNKVKVCDDVQNVSFSAEDNIIYVNLQIGNYKKTTKYVIEKIQEQIIL